MHQKSKESGQMKENGHTIDFLPPTGEPRDKYDAYLYSGEETEDPSRNIRNIFDDSNVEDRKWSRMAKRYLSKNR